MIQNRDARPISRIGAFTMIEMVFVISLVALLAVITIGVGATMADAGRKRATEGVLQALDQSLADYVQKTGSNPPALVGVTLSEDLGGNMRGQTVYYPAVDGVLNEVIPGTDPARHYAINSVGLYLESIKGVVDIDSLLSGVDVSLVRNHDVADDYQPSMLTVFDAWGNPIRYVHPKFDGIIEDSTGPGDRRALGDAGAFLSVMDEGDGFFTAAYLPEDDSLIPFLDGSVGGEVRRNKILTIDHEEARANGLDYPVEADSDGGKCPSQRPYFYSAGPDGDPSTIDDNVYTTRPEFIDPL